MVELQWTKPEKDGGSPISGYVIEYKDKFSKDWSKGAVSIVILYSNTFSIFLFK